MSNWFSAYWFSFFLVVGSAVTGLICLFDRLFLAKRRTTSTFAAECLEHANSAQAANVVESSVCESRKPWIVRTSAELFPVITLVLVVRSFLFEPFQIPSGSMMPTLLSGDFILVKKFAYGVREPLGNRVVFETQKPKRGDIAVFRFPLDWRVHYIKRVVGLPGDRVVYQDKKLWVEPACEKDGCEPLQRVPRTYIEQSSYKDQGRALDWYSEDLDGHQHALLINPFKPDYSDRFWQMPDLDVGEWVVPEGHYFVMGDNRDNSADSRFWGFVPDDKLVGEAVGVWASFEFNWSNPLFSWVPSKIRFERIGGIQ